MYYIVMYGSLLLSFIALLACGISMVFTPADKVKLKSGQNRDTAVRKMRSLGKLCIAACIAVIILIVFAVMSIGIENIPGVGY